MSARCTARAQRDVHSHIQRLVLQDNLRTSQNTYRQVMIQPQIQTGTVLVNSIGCGCDVFFRVISRTNATLVVQELEDVVQKINVDQSSFIVPGGSLKNKKPIKLRVTTAGKIGPTQSWIWWSVWDGKPRNQFSS